MVARRRPRFSCLRGVLVATLCVLSAMVFHSAITTTQAATAELLMFEEAGCPWCAKWHKEVGPGYARSPEGKRAPLRQLDLRAALPVGVRLEKPVRASPTFVLVEDGREIGRITGYPGPDFFWGLLGEMMRKLAPLDTSKARRTRAASLGIEAGRE